VSDPGTDKQAADTRKARFGALPERVAFEDMVEEKPVLSSNQAVDAYDPDGLAVRFSCLAADLGL
jgi:hypothetical protein